MTEPHDIAKLAAEMRARAEAAIAGTVYGNAQKSRVRVFAADILTLLDALDARGRWEPIETAPKDGTKVWLAYVAVQHYPNNVLVNEGIWNGKRWYSERHHQMYEEDYKVFAWHEYFRPSEPEIAR